MKAAPQKLDSSAIQITVIGSGYVGLVAAVGLCELGHRVICVDNDIEKIEKLRRGILPIHEQHLPELVQRYGGRSLVFSTDLTAAVQKSRAVFIAVGTPSNGNGEADLSYVEAVARELARAVSEYTVIVEKSTVPVYTSEWIRRSMLLNGAQADIFDVVSNPEFLSEGSAVRDFLYPDRIVIGGDNDRAVSVVRQIYSPLEDGTYYGTHKTIPAPAGFHGSADVIVTSTKGAELIKHASNAFLAMKISFVNAVANICEGVGADVSEVARGIGADTRIGGRFLNPGIGYGGSCFPKDLKAFRAVAAAIGYDFRLLDEVAAINEDQQNRFVRKLRAVLWNLKGKRIAVLGLAFKGGTDDIRESPAVAIVKRLLQEHCKVTVFDPAARHRIQEITSDVDNFTLASDCYDALKDAEAALILTDWAEFAELDLDRVRKLMRHPVLIDGRNLFEPSKVAAKGLLYFSIGRPPAYPKDFPVDAIAAYVAGAR